MQEEMKFYMEILFVDRTLCRRVTGMISGDSEEGRMGL